MCGSEAGRIRCSRVLQKRNGALREALAQIQSSQCVEDVGAARSQQLRKVVARAPVLGIQLGGALIRRDRLFALAQLRQHRSQQEVRSRIPPTGGEVGGAVALCPRQLIRCCTILAAHTQRLGILGIEPQCGVRGLVTLCSSSRPEEKLRQDRVQAGLIWPRQDLTT